MVPIQIFIFLLIIYSSQLYVNLRGFFIPFWREIQIFRLTAQCPADNVHSRASRVRRLRLILPLSPHTPSTSS